jgi:hypothetical protein
MFLEEHLLGSGTNHKAEEPKADANNLKDNDIVIAYHYKANANKFYHVP